MLDEVLFVTREGVMSVVKVAPKFHVGSNPCHVAVFKRDEQAVYNMIYREGRQGRVYAKRFRVGGLTRDKEYHLASEAPATRVLYFQRFETEEESSADRRMIHLQPKPRLRNLLIDYKFSDLMIKGRESKGNIVTENSVDKILMYREGGAE
jgi:topoisomerase IV subunit A